MFVAGRAGLLAGGYRDIGDHHNAPPPLGGALGGRLHLSRGPTFTPINEIAKIA